MRVFSNKFIEVLTSVAPIVVLVIFLGLTLAPLSGTLMLRFILGSLFIILGLVILLIGVDVGFIPFGTQVGLSLIRSNKMLYIIIVAFILGFFINYAEPDLQVLAIQVADAMNNTNMQDIIRLCVATGTGLMLMLGIIRIVKVLPLNIMMLIVYAVAFTLVIFTEKEMISIAFDASGAATGIITVPLVLAVAMGISSSDRDSKSGEEDSFGLVGVMASGAVIGVLLLNLIFSPGSETIAAEVVTSEMAGAEATFFSLVFIPFAEAAFGYSEGGSRIPGAIVKTALGMLPVIVMLIAFQIFKFHLRKIPFLRILIGFIYSYLGIVLFFIGANAGFMEVGKEIGSALAGQGAVALIGVGCLLGMVGILTEPAVHVLTHQIEDVTSGFIKRKNVLRTLAIGVAIAVGLSMLKVVVPSIMLWHYLVPGFAITVTLSFFVPKVFVGIAFDSGSVASGPMAATFVLAFARGAAETNYPGFSPNAVVAEAFGVLAMIAMTPLIALQVLGLLYKIKSRKSGV